MFNSNPLGPNFNEGMVDRLLGKAYLTIKEVHDNLEEISKATSITEDNKAVRDSVDKLTEALGAFEKGSGLFIGHDLGEVGEEIDSNTYIGDNFLTSLTKSTSHIETVGNDITVIDTLAAHINELKAIAEALDDILNIQASTEEVNKITPYIEDIQNVSANREAIQSINTSIDDLKTLSENINSFPEIINSVAAIDKVSKYIASIVTCASNIAAYLEANQKLETAQAVIENGSLDKVANIAEPIQAVANNVSSVKIVADNIDSITNSGGLVSRVEVVENTVNTHESRIAANESSKEDHETRITENTANLANLTSRVTATENINAAQATTLAEYKTRLDNMETSSDVGQLATRLTAIDANIENIKTTYLPLAGGEMVIYDGTPMLAYSTSDAVEIVEDNFTGTDTDHSTFIFKSSDAYINFTNEQNDKNITLSTVKYTSTINLNLKFCDTNKWYWLCELPATTSASSLTLDTTASDCVTWLLSSYQPNHTDNTEEKPTVPVFATANVISTLTLVAGSSFEGTATITIYSLCNCYKETVGTKENWDATLIKKYRDDISANTTAISTLSETLQNSINTEISALTTNLSAEESARKTVDEEITSSLTEVQTTVSSMDSRLDNFVTLSTAETITGKKTFSQAVKVNDAITATGKLTGQGVELLHDTPFIDFHYGSDSDSDYTSRIIEKTKGNLTVVGNLFANSPASTATGTEVVTAKWVTDKLASSSSSGSDSSGSSTDVGSWFPMFGEASNVRCTGTRHEVSTVKDTYQWTAPEACWVVVEGKGGTTSGKDCFLYCTIAYGVEAHFGGTGSNTGDNVYVYSTCFMPKGAILKVTMSGLSWIYFAHTAIYKDSTTRPSSDTPSE